MTDAREQGVRVLHRDPELLVLYKPSGLSTTSPDGKNCLTELAARLDPDAPNLHASSRLDAEVTGVVTFARTRGAIAALLDSRKAGSYERYYLALASQAPAALHGEWQWAIDQDPRDKRRRVAATKSSATAQSASSRYRVVGVQPSAVLIVLMPQTGRTHQLRVHAAKAGLPLLGDKHYGGPMQAVLPDGRVLRASRVMLHCARVRLPDIAGGAGKMLTIDAPAPEDFERLWKQLGGDVSLLAVPSDS
jgi:23S rRNA-/tRNA-specific pseudouridylate synthase